MKMHLKLSFAVWVLMIVAACTGKVRSSKVGDCISRVDSGDILKVTRIDEQNKTWVQNLSKQGSFEELPAPTNHFVEVPCSPAQ